MTSFTRRTIVLGVVGIVMGASARAVEEPSRNLSTYALLAVHELVGSSFTVTAGDVGVSAGRLRVSRALSAAASAVGGDTTDLGGGSTCAALFSNNAVRGPASCGPAAPFDGPLFEDVAASCGFPPGSFPACDPSQNRTVPLSGTLHLDPGTYGTITIAGKGGRTGGVLVLGPGTYRFCGITASHGGQVRFQGPAQVFVTGRLVFNSETVIAPAGTDQNPAVVPTDVRLFVQNGDILFSHRAKVRAEVCAPLATLRIKNNADLFGTFVAGSIRIGHGTTVAVGGPPRATTTTTIGTSSTSTSRTTTTTSSSSSSAPSTLPQIVTSTLQTTSSSSTSTSRTTSSTSPGTSRTTTTSSSSSMSTRPAATTSSTSTSRSSTTRSSTSTSRTTTTSVSTTRSSTSTSSSRTTTSSSTSSTTLPGAGCPAKLVFATTSGTTGCGGAALSPAPQPPASGSISDTSAKLADLGLSCLYVGGGGNTGTAPNPNPDGGATVFSVGACSGSTLNLGGDAGSAASDCTLGPAATKHCTRTGAACTSNADCGGSVGLCNPDPRCFFGPPLPLPAGPTSTCVLNVFRAAASGTVDRAAGTSNISLPLASYVYLTGNSSRVCTNLAAGTDHLGTCFNDAQCGGTPGTCQPVPPCPRCIATAQGSRCLSGKRHGQACTPVGSKLTTLDCPPKDNTFIAPLNVTLAPLGTSTSTLTAAANGRFCPVATAATCTTTSDPGNCQRTPGCFGKVGCRRIVETGAPAGSLGDGHAHAVTVAATFCIPATGNALIDGGTGADLPGPGAVSIRGTFRTIP